MLTGTYFEHLDDTVLLGFILNSDLEELERARLDDTHLYHKLLNTPFCLESICRKYGLNSFEKAQKKWFFTDEYSDEYRQRNYSSFGSLTKCIKMGCRSGYWDFVGFLFHENDPSEHELIVLAEECCGDFEKFEDSLPNIDFYTSVAFDKALQRKLPDKKIRYYIDEGLIKELEIQNLRGILGEARWSLLDLIHLYTPEEGDKYNILDFACEVGNLDMLKNKDVPQIVFDTFGWLEMKDVDRRVMIRSACECGQPEVLDYLEATPKEAQEYVLTNHINSIFFWYVKKGGDVLKIGYEKEQTYSRKIDKYMKKFGI